MSVIIRQAVLEDTASIAILSGQMGYVPDESAVRNRLTEILQDQGDCVFVAVFEGTVVGWIHGFYTRRIESDAFVEIGGMVVGQQYRQKGIGRGLVDKVLNWAKTKNSQKLRVRCNTIRTETHIFYEKLGFKCSKSQKIFDITVD